MPKTPAERDQARRDAARKAADAAKALQDRQAQHKTAAAQRVANRAGQGKGYPKR